jgi:hypothetical protein
MLGLLTDDVEVLIRESTKRFPEAVRQEIDRLKAVCDDSVLVHSPGSSSARSGSTTMAKP